MIDRQPTTPKKARIVVAHDWLCGLRGGERVLERICALVEREFEPAGLVAMFDDGQSIGPTVDAWVSGGLLRTSWLNRSGARGMRRWLLPFYPSAVGQLSRAVGAIHRESPIDLLISSSSAAIKGLTAPSGVPHLCYCHSPARYVWAPDAERSGGISFKDGVRAAGLRLIGPGFRAWDRRTSAGVTGFIANSTRTAALIQEAYQRSARVIFPPVRTDFFTPDASVRREDFWLFAGALEPYKRVDLAIRAAALAGKKLVIAGSGSQAAAARRLAKDAGAEVEFAGRVSDERLRDLYRRAHVLIFPQIEDFGIIAAEAQACGLCVAARGSGGALDTVVDGGTGVLFHEATPEAIVQAVRKVPQGAEAACRASALRFAESEFDGKMLREISAALAAQG